VAWPPTLDDLKADMRDTTARDDAALQIVLDAAIAFVERVHAGGFNFAGELITELPDPPADFVLGTLRLAGRWHVRRRSPDGLVAAGDLGNQRVPSVDQDIARLLRIDRYRGSVIA
jgi:hypothetical protein